MALQYRCRSAGRQSCAGRSDRGDAGYLTGLDWPAIEPLDPLITSMAAEKDMVPVLEMDHADIVAVRRKDLPYDTLPDVAANAVLPNPMPGRDWPAYVARCRQLLASKWQPTAIVHLGSHADWEDDRLVPRRCRVHQL
jgi:hypothetical protein